MDYQELIERLRGFEIDHEPNGWPAIQMRDISAMCDVIESLLNALDVAEGEVKRTAAERDAALAELAKYRDAHVVAWVEVIDSYEGPYHFHGQKLLGVGKHKLIVKPGENK